MGRRRRPSRLPVRSLTALAAALVVVGVLFALPDRHPDRPAPVDAAVTPSPTWQGPATSDTPAVLPDGTGYTPRIFLSPTTSVGVAATPDGHSMRLLSVGARTTELRRLPVDRSPQFAGFVVSGDTLVWAETTTDGTELWRTDWKTAARPVLIESDAGAVAFTGSQYDLVINAGRVYWTRPVDGGTEVASVGMDGYDDESRDLTGDFGLSAWPWVVSHGGQGARGEKMTLIDLNTNRRLTVSPTPNQTATCTPVWCRLDTAGDTALVRIDLRHPDGTGARQVAGAEATPAIVDVAMLDRYIPLITDRNDGTGLSLYDITSGRTDLVAIDIDNVHASGGILWWTTGDGDDVEWHAIDVRTLA